MRKLASIQKIKALEKIEGADAIEKATVLGWQLVVKKAEFAVGDLCIYCEVDCLMPDKPEFGFLKPHAMRIRTILLRGQISQGICLPLSMLPPDMVPVENMDVTDVLGITKYDPPIPANLAGIAKGPFPSFVPKTDETRVQVLEETLQKYEGETCFITEKLDGSSATFYIQNGVFGVCSRNLDLIEDESNSLWKVARETGIEEKLRSLNINVAIQGEIIGEGIQSNKYRLKGQKIFFFNAFDIDKYQYFGFEQFTTLMRSLDLETVPVLATGYLLEKSVEAIVKRAIIKSQLQKDVWAEGIVIRPLTEKTDSIGRVSFKAINPEFLLKFGE